MRLPFSARLPVVIRDIKLTRHSLVATLISYKGFVAVVESYAPREDKYLLRHIPDFEHVALEGDYIVLEDIRFGATEWMDLEFEGEEAVKVIRFVARATLHGEPDRVDPSALWER